MIEIKNKSNCCGCHACFNICPADAIEMKEDIKGFKYPVIKDFQYTFGCIALDRENDRAAAKNMIEAMRNIKNGDTVIPHFIQQLK